MFCSVVLGQVDLWLDVVSIVSTSQVVRAFTGWTLCGRSVVPFFRACMYVQLLLLAGNLLSQACVAAYGARRTGQNPALAFIRGLFNLQLGYLEFSKRQRPSSDVASASLAIRLNELVWEAPQLVLSWCIMLARVSVQYTVNRADMPKPDIPVTPWVMVLQPLSACVGILSLSLAVLDLSRLHPYSFWAFTAPPLKSLLFIVDVDPKTWKRSLMIGIHSFVSITNHAFIYISLLMMILVQNAVEVPEGNYSPGGSHLNPVGFNRLQPNTRTAIFWVIIVAVFVINVFLHIGMRSWRILPASVISMFVTIPWIAAKDVGSAWGSGPHSNWPSWVLTAMHSLALVILVPFAQYRTGKEFDERVGPFQEICKAQRSSWEVTE